MRVVPVRWPVAALMLLLLRVGGAEITTNDGSADAKAWVDRLVGGNDVMVFAKSYCPYCRHTQNLLEEVENQHGTLKFEFVHLDQMSNDEDARTVQMELLARTGQRTVPNIFIGGVHIGGDSHVTDLYNSGELQTMLEDVAAVKSSEL